MSANPLPRNRARRGNRSRGVLRAALVVAGFTGLLWLIEAVDVTLGHRLDDGGISPRDPYELPDIVTAPLLHADFEHLAANTMPLLVLGFLAALRGLARFLAVSAVIVAVSGLGVWLTAPDNTVTLGASGLIFGYFGYVVLRGFLDGNPLDIGIGILIAVLYGSILWGVLPVESDVSWQGHLFGLLGGVLAAYLFRGRRRRARSAG